MCKHIGSGSFPSVWYNAIFRHFGDLKPYAFLIVSFALRFRPSAAPLESSPFALNQFMISCLWFRSMLATFFIGSRFVWRVRVIQLSRNFSAAAGYLYSQNRWKSSRRRYPLIEEMFSFRSSPSRVVCFSLRFSGLFRSSQRPLRKSHRV